MYDLTKAVGPQRPNLPDDVRLITTLFFTLQSFNDPFMNGIPKVAIGSIFTPALGQAIVKYQKNLRESNGHNVVDGVIDPLPSRSGDKGDWDSAFSNGAKSTLSYLCYRMFRISRDVYMKMGDTLNLPWVPDPFDLST